MYFYRDLRRIRGYISSLIILRKISPQTRLDLSMYNIYIHIYIYIRCNWYTHTYMYGCLLGLFTSEVFNQQNRLVYLLQYHLYKSLWPYDSLLLSAWKRSRKSKCVESDHLTEGSLVGYPLRHENPAANLKASFAKLPSSWRWHANAIKEWYGNYN